MEITLRFLLSKGAGITGPGLWLSLAFNRKDESVWFEEHDHQMSFPFHIPFSCAVFVEMVSEDAPSALFP